MLFILYYFFSHQYQGRSGFVVQDWNPKFRLTHFRIKSVDSWSSQKSDIELLRWTESHCIKIFYVCRTRNRSSVTIYLKKICQSVFFSSFFSALVVMLVIISSCARSRGGPAVEHPSDTTETNLVMMSLGIVPLETSRYKALRGICYRGDDKFW